MSQSLTYTFDAREADFHKVGSWLAFRQGGWIPLAGYAVVLLVASVVGAWTQLWAIPLIALFGGLALMPLHRRHVLRKVAKGPLVAGRARYRFDSTGYDRQSAVLRSRGDWSIITRVLRTKTHVVLDFGSGSLLAVSHEALTPRTPEAVAAQFELWIAGEGGGERLDVEDELTPPQFLRLFNAANRKRPGQRQTLSLVLIAVALFALVLWNGVAAVAGLPMWTSYVMLGAVIGGFYLWSRREGQRYNTQVKTNSAFDGPVTAQFDADGWKMAGEIWSMEGPWTPEIRLHALKGALALELGPLYFLPIPADALAPQRPADVKDRIEALRGG